jgi:hypothetical protein
LIFTAAITVNDLIKEDFLTEPKIHFRDTKLKGKGSPVQAWRCPEGSWRFRLPDFMTIDS